MDLLIMNKIFCPDLKNRPDIFDHRGIDRHHGALLIVRADQFIAKVQHCNDYAALSVFFAPFMVER